MTNFKAILGGATWVLVASTLMFASMTPVQARSDTPSYAAAR